MASQKNPSKDKTITNVTRISASDKPSKSSRINFLKRGMKKSQKKSIPVKDKSEKKTKNPIVLFWRYIKGSWFELRQVRWPDRQSTWQMTGALLLFTLFFVIVVLLLDASFKWMFQQILS